MNKNLIMLPFIFFYVNACDKGVVVVPVADLRANKTNVPNDLVAPALPGDIGQQLSQVLFGEKLIINSDKSDKDWYFVEVPGQPVVVFPFFNLFGELRREYCSGFMLRSNVKEVDDFPVYDIALQDLWTTVYSDASEDSNPVIQLPFGTMVETKKIDAEWREVYFLGDLFGYIKESSNLYEVTHDVVESCNELREKLVNLAMKFIGCPYVWGGRSPFKQDLNSLSSDQQITGVDCSGFVSLIFESVGLLIPKNSTSQYYEAPKKIESGADLMPGDLLFLKNKDNKFAHVMLYVGNDLIIESAGFGLKTKNDAAIKNLTLQDLCVRVVDLKNYIHESIGQMKSDTIVYEGREYCLLMASYLNTDKDVQSLRAKFFEQ